MLKETLMTKFSSELNINKEILVKDDKPKTKTYVKKVTKRQKDVFENEFLLLLFLLENHKNTLSSYTDDFFNFIEGTKREEIATFKDVITQINKEDLARKESPLFAKAMMAGLNLSEDEVVDEFIRASDVIRLMNYLLNI